MYLVSQGKRAAERKKGSVLEMWLHMMTAPLGVGYKQASDEKINEYSNELEHIINAKIINVPATHSINKPV